MFFTLGLTPPYPSQLGQPCQIRDGSELMTLNLAHGACQIFKPAP